MVPALDVLAGLSFLGAAVFSVRWSRRYAAVAALASLAWFVAPEADAVLLLHRPLLLHAALGFATGRIGGWGARGVLAAAWVAALVPAIGRHPGGMLLLGAAVAGAAWARRGRTAWARGDGDAAAHATAALALSLVLPAAGRLIRPEGDWAELLAALYSGLVLLAGLLLLGGLVRRAQHGEMDAVIELSETSSGEVGSALRRAAGSADFRGDRSALLAAAELLDANAALQARLAGRVEEVRASRRRLVAAGVTERRRLEEELDGGAGRYLDELRTILRRLPTDADGEVGRLVAACDAEAGRAQEDLAQLGRGLHPRLLVDGGLRPALDDLASTCPLAVEVRVPDGRFPDPVEAAVWYACAEALTNAVKHAAARTATVEVVLDGGDVVAAVTDDGDGGARLAPGGGLAGLADRLGALGGGLRLEPGTTGGTRVTIRVPAS